MMTSKLGRKYAEAWKSWFYIEKGWNKHMRADWWAGLNEYETCANDDGPKFLSFTYISDFI